MLLTHQKYIQRCIEIASNGIGTTRPNPSVGAVIVYNDTIIAEGFTSPYGGSHAEVNAIAAVKDKTLLSKATMYVTLEPCSHFGKTPPCANLIVKHKIPKVVIGCVDTNDLVSGKGIAILKEAGCEVITGVLEEACKEHHKRFFSVQNKKRPYIILKWAETKNGFIAPKTRTAQAPVWISNSFSKQLVHKWRAEEHAILVGTNTVVADNPSLNVRSWFGNNPIRVVLDKDLRIDTTATVLDGTIPTMVLCSEASTASAKAATLLANKAISLHTIDFSNNVAAQIIAVLQAQKIQSVFIEGGSQTLQTFIDANLWDEARVFTGNTVFEEGIKAPTITGEIIEQTHIDTDVLKVYKND